MMYIHERHNKEIEETEQLWLEREVAEENIVKGALRLTTHTNVHNSL